MQRCVSEAILNAARMCFLLRRGNITAGGLFQFLRYPGIQTFIFSLRGENGCPMHLRPDSDDELSREWLFRFFSELCAGLQIVLNGFFEGLSQFIDRAALEGYNIAEIDNLTVEQSGFGIKFHGGDIFFIFHNIYNGQTCQYNANRRILCVCFVFTA